LSPPMRTMVGPVWATAAAVKKATAAKMQIAVWETTNLSITLITLAFCLVLMAYLLMQQTSDNKAIY
jgi:hypothetical protein